MASMTFIIKDDHPAALTVSGDLMDIVACTTYLIGKIYHYLNAQEPAAGKALQELLVQAISDPKSPVWDMPPVEGETVICAVQPKDSDG